MGNAEEYSFSGLFPGLPGNAAWEETGWKPGWEGRRVGGGKREQPGAWQARGTAAGQRIRVQPPPLQLGRGAWQAAAGQRSRPPPRQLQLGTGACQEHGSGAAPQSAAVTPCRAALAISRTWPWMTEASSKYLAAEVEAGRCREIEEQVRISEQGRGANQNSPPSNLLVTCTSASVFLQAFVESYLQLLIKVQVSSAHSAYACSVLTLPARAHVRSFDQRVLELESVGRAH